MDKKYDLTEGNVLKTIVYFMLPILAGNVFQQLYTVVDTMVVGKYLGVSALAALGASNWLNWLICMYVTHSALPTEHMHPWKA